MNGQERCYKKQFAIIVSISDLLPPTKGSYGIPAMKR